MDKAIVSIWCHSSCLHGLTAPMGKSCRAWGVGQFSFIVVGWKKSIGDEQPISWAVLDLSVCALKTPLIGKGFSKCTNEQVLVVKR